MQMIAIDDSYFQLKLLLNHALQQSDSVRPQYKTVDLSEIELPDVDTNNNTLLLEVRIKHIFF